MDIIKIGYTDTFVNMHKSMRGSRKCVSCTVASHLSLPMFPAQDDPYPAVQRQNSLGVSHSQRTDILL